MKHFRRHTNPNPRDPVPLIRDFFRQAKDQRSHSQLLTSRDYATIREIFKARSHRRFNSQSIANLLLAIAYHHTQWRFLPRDLPTQLWSAITQNIERFNPQNVTNTLWIFATLRVKWEELGAQGLNDCLLNAVHHNADQLNPQGIVNTLWALGTMGVHWRELEVRELTDRLLEAVRYNASRFKSQEIANILWALTTLSVRRGSMEA